MAMVKRTSQCPEMEGKNGGNIYRFDQCRQHIQAYPRLINREKSPSQKIILNSFQKALNRYLYTLTPEQRNKWYTYTFQHIQTTKKGMKYYLPPQLMYMKINIPRIKNNLPPFDDPPG